MKAKYVNILKDDKLRDALKELYKRAATDFQFRQLALANAEEALRKIGIEVKDVSLQFVEPRKSEKDVLRLQLPHYVDISTELDEHELEAVAGGALLECVPITCDQMSRRD